jgi:general secretion pathway protein G
MRNEKGFTLIELLIVIAIIGIIAGIAVAQLRTAPQKAREAVLKEDLYAMRDVIDQYFADKGKYPESLDALVDEGYLRKIPEDPITKSTETWQIVHAEDTGEDPDADAAGGVIDVKSGADGTALDGSSYSDW